MTVQDIKDIAQLIMRAETAEGQILETNQRLASVLVKLKNAEQKLFQIALLAGGEEAYTNDFTTQVQGILRSED